jgi:hypothetical protein
MSRMRGNTLHPDSKQPTYPMKMAFQSRFRLDFSSSLFFATAYSAIP